MPGGGQRSARPAFPLPPKTDALLPLRPSPPLIFAKISPRISRISRMTRISLEQKRTKETKEEFFFITFVCFCANFIPGAAWMENSASVKSAKSVVQVLWLRRAALGSLRSFVAKSAAGFKIKGAFDYAGKRYMAKKEEMPVMEQKAGPVESALCADGSSGNTCRWGNGKIGKQKRFGQDEQDLQDSEQSQKGEFPSASCSSCQNSVLLDFSGVF